jgi:hypothetical protein
MSVGWTVMKKKIHCGLLQCLYIVTTVLKRYFPINSGWAVAHPLALPLFGGKGI